MCSSDLAQIIDSGARIYDLGAQIIDSGAVSVCCFLFGFCCFLFGLRRPVMREHALKKNGPSFPLPAGTKERCRSKDMLRLSDCALYSYLGECAERKPAGCVTG